MQNIGKMFGKCREGGFALTTALFCSLYLTLLQYKPLQNTVMLWKVAMEKSHMSIAVLMFNPSDVRCMQIKKTKCGAFKNSVVSPRQICTSFWPGWLFQMRKQIRGEGGVLVFFSFFFCFLVRDINATPSHRNGLCAHYNLFLLTKSHACASVVAPSVLLMLDCAKNISGFVGYKGQLRQREDP